MYLARSFGLVFAIVAITLPLLEIAVMIKVGSAIGFWPSIAIIMVTGLIGSWVLQTHGLIMMRRFQEKLDAGQPPLEPMIEGSLLFLAAILLISPGFICDAVGFILLIQPVRAGLAKIAHDRLWGRVDVDVEVEKPADERGSPFADQAHQAERDMKRARGSGPIIEGEFERVEDPPSDGRSNPRGQPGSQR